MTGAAASNSYQLVELSKVNPQIIIDLKYATRDNFLKQAVYPDKRCFVLNPLAEKLDLAQKILAPDGLGLKVYDGFRPLAVQQAMWKVLPDARYVANPLRGGSIHNRGVAVDLTLVDEKGKELEMPTEFDDFSSRAGQYSLEPTAAQRANRMLLRKVMHEVGLVPIKTEWWHYELPNGKSYPIIK